MKTTGGQPYEESQDSERGNGRTVDRVDRVKLQNESTRFMVEGDAEKLFWRRKVDSNKEVDFL
jgi:hypothetical protein